MCVYACMYVKSALSKDFPWVVNTGCLEGKGDGRMNFGRRGFGTFFIFRRWIIKSLSSFISIFQFVNLFVNLACTFA